MKKKFAFVLLSVVVLSPFSARASIFEELVGAVKNLQKQVVELVSIKIDLPATSTVPAVNEDWSLFTDRSRGFEVRFPSDWSTTTIFSITPRYRDAVAFVRNSRLTFLSKILKPETAAVDLAIQDAAIFFRATSTEIAATYLKEVAPLVSTSTKQFGSSTAIYVLRSSKTDANKFGGGSMEEYIFTNGSTTIIAEANYSEEIPSGPVKVVFDKMLSSFRFVATTGELVSGTSTDPTGSSTPLAVDISATSTTPSATSSGTKVEGKKDQTAGVKLGQ